MAQTRETNRVAAKNGSTRRKSAKRSRLTRTHQIQAGCLFALALMLLCVSLPHLANGIQRITSSNLLAAWLMAIVFDLAQVVSEMALLLTPIVGVGRPIGSAARGVIVCCTLISMVLNVQAFVQHARGWQGTALAVSWGVLLPLGVLTLSYLGSAFLLSGHAWEKSTK